MISLSTQSSRNSKTNARKITNNSEIAQVGTISANGDPESGRYLAEAMEKVGNEGVITVEEAKTAETELEVVEGMQFDRGCSETELGSPEAGVFRL